MQTCRLTERIQLLKYTTSATTFGGVVEFWKPSRTMFMSLTNQRGDRSFNDQSHLYQDSISFYGRYAGDHDKKSTRIKYKCDEYVIDNITHIRKEATIIDCHKIK
jgi:head-tail adaptor